MGNRQIIKGHLIQGKLLSRIPAAIIVIAITLLIITLASARYYIRVTKPVITLKDKKSCYFFIHTGSGFREVKDSLIKKGYLNNPKYFEWLSIRKRYDQHVKPGRYRLVNGMQNNALINLLRSGNQEPVRVVIQNVRTRAELAGKLGRYLETDSAQLLELFDNPSHLAKYDISPSNLFALFIPDTYEFLWNTSATQLLKRMHDASEIFWTAQRRKLADSLHLSVAEVIVLASIVEKESNKNDEKPVIAGVYLNRLKKQMPLQADPTVIFAWNDFSIRRVLKKHTELQSPYNTYFRSGLPPGPICMPSVSSIEAVLKAENHSYYYFCAREDLSGYHNFAADLEGHNQNARKYQKALNKMNVK